MKKLSSSSIKKSKSTKQFQSVEIYIKYKLQRLSFKAFKNVVEKHKYYTNKISIIYRHYKT